VVHSPGLIRLAVLAGVLLALAGCAELTRWDPDAPAPSAAPIPGVHVVQRGDTLVKIAFTIAWTGAISRPGTASPMPIASTRDSVSG
jgi:hypothetical protein